MLKRLLIALLPLVPLNAERTCEEDFTHIYDHGMWGKDSDGHGNSGPGSSPVLTEEYRPLLQNFLKDREIQSVVDLGSGDWWFSRMMDWSGIDYTGVDVVKKLVDQNNRLFGSPTIRFIQLDATKEELPAADLLICKDVLQHLTLRDIRAILAQTGKFRYCLITNDVAPVVGGINSDVSCRSFSGRSIVLSLPPFNLKGEVLLNYQAGPTVKQVFLISTENG